MGSPSVTLKKSNFVFLIVFALINVHCAPERRSYSSDEPSVLAISSNELDSMTAKINRSRKNLGLPALRSDPTLNAVSEAFAKDMKQRGYFGHQTPEGKTVNERLKEHGLNFTISGENIAQGQPDAAEALNDWMQSTHHRANILNPNFTRFGIGHSCAIWVQTFAD